MKTSFSSKTVRKSLTLACLMLCSNTITAQSDSVPNGNFEQWINSGAYEDPAGWGTLNWLVIYDIPPTCIKTTDAYAGNYALSLEAKEYDGFFGLDTIAGWAFTGTFPENGDPRYGFALNSRPNELSGYYKFQSAVPDSFQIAVVLTKWDSASNSQVTIGAGELVDTQNISVYTPFTINIEYFSSDMPDSATIHLLASASSDDSGEGAIPGSILKIDELFFGYPTGKLEPVFSDRKAVVYPNPATEYIDVFNQAGCNCELVLFDLQGNPVMRTNIAQTGVSQVKTGSLANGAYFYLFLEKEVILEKGKIIIQK